LFLVIHGNIMQSKTVQCLNPRGFHRMRYTDWGDAANPRIVICVHGLTRNCRDFDTLAEALQNDFRVVCPDVTGRGQSGWLPAKEHYTQHQYMADMTVLLAQLAAEGEKETLWVGTSMGGILGMLLASLPGTPLKKLVINDVGALIPKAAIERIGQYVGADPHFAALEDVEKFIRTVSAPFGPLTDAQWAHLTLHNAKQNTDGKWGLNYDPGIAQVFKQAIIDIDLWASYDAIRCNTLLLRGAQSDLLLKDTALAMTQRGPCPKLVEFDGVGHAPMLMADDQIKVVRDFLRS
jgi:pimeloyl-ACP methyl ester carboxylesterase